MSFKKYKPVNINSCSDKVEPLNNASYYKFLNNNNPKFASKVNTNIVRLDQREIKSLLDKDVFVSQDIETFALEESAIPSTRE